MLDEQIATEAQVTPEFQKNPDFKKLEQALIAAAINLLKKKKAEASAQAPVDGGEEGSVSKYPPPACEYASQAVAICLINE